jgi:hypothetical protein
MTRPRLWEKLHLSQWGRIKAMADHLGFKVQRLISGNLYQHPDFIIPVDPSWSCVVRCQFRCQKSISETREPRSSEHTLPMLRSS